MSHFFFYWEGRILCPAAIECCSGEFDASTMFVHRSQLNLL